jgi:hypothetical protein
MSKYQDLLQAHYQKHWKREGTRIRLSEGPLWELPEDYCVMVFPPSVSPLKPHPWIYATCGMSQGSNGEPLELFIHSPVESHQVVDLLNMTAHFHHTGERLGWGHTVNFGKSWLPESKCDHGLISLPYLDGPRLEQASIDGANVRILWLIPITKAEREFKKAQGLEALEALFQKKQFNYLDPARPSVAP